VRVVDVTHDADSVGTSEMPLEADVLGTAELRATDVSSLCVGLTLSLAATTFSLCVGAP
jgi:hypothetical protein